jgi:hypothetical protein
MKLKFTILALIVLVISFRAISQEVITGLEYNVAVKNKAMQAKDLKSAVAYDTVYVTLPFYDDFSTISVWPSPEKWADNYTFINTDFAKNPRTIGVATLDAIDETGALYPEAGSYPFEADKLTSQPIRLDSVFTPVKKAITVRDSVYLSFLYQPQGRGAMPAKKDSLILEFHSPANIDTIIGETDTIYSPRWDPIWSTGGGIQVDTFALYNHGYFKQVLIPITDSASYFKKGFRFRFRNYASLASSSMPDWQSNGDQWNIDMVFLNTGRTVNDTSMKDIAFADKAPSMLRNYQAMPYRQYRKNFLNEMQDTLDIRIANIDNVPHNISYGYKIQKDSQSPYEEYDAGYYSIYPFSGYGYSNYTPFAHPPVKSFYPIGTEDQQKVAFHTTHYITTDPNLLIKQNDTIRFTQLFSNYYAYDDGTAEAGIGLNGAAGYYAVQFELNVEDTLRGIQLYINQTLSGNNNQYINLIVWNDYLGAPGQIVGQMTDVIPLDSDSLNIFRNYWFDSPVIMDKSSFPGLIFYVGWQQGSIDNLNIGFDRYTDSHSKRFFNVTGNWQSSDSQHAGSLMLRPIVGPENPLSTPENRLADSFKLYPNPVTNDYFNISLPADWRESDNISVEIFDASGRLVQKSNYSQVQNCKHFVSGIYLVRLINNSTSRRLSQRLIVSR